MIRFQSKFGFIDNWIICQFWGYFSSNGFLIQILSCWRFRGLNFSQESALYLLWSMCCIRPVLLPSPGGVVGPVRGGGQPVRPLRFQSWWCNWFAVIVRQVFIQCFCTFLYRGHHLQWYLLFPCKILDLHYLNRGHGVRVTLGQILQGTIVPMQFTLARTGWASFWQGAARFQVIQFNFLILYVKTCSFYHLDFPFLTCICLFCLCFSSINFLCWSNLCCLMLADGIFSILKSTRMLNLIIWR